MLWWILGLLQVTPGVTLVKEAPAASSDSTIHRARCSGKLAVGEFENSSSRAGRVSSFQLDGAEVPAAAATLTDLARGRDIERVSFLTCPMRAGGYRLNAVMILGDAASKRVGLRNAVWFSVERDGIVLTP